MTISFGPSGPISGEPLVVVAGGTTQTTSTTGSPVWVGAHDTARLNLDVTAKSGTTPSLTVAVQTSPDASTWTTVASFSAASTVSSQHKLFAPLDQWVRANTTISGTSPSFTFGVTGTAV